MDDKTRQQFKRALEDMIKEATDREEAARELQKVADDKRAEMESILLAGSSSRARRGVNNTQQMKDQIAELEQEAVEEMEKVQVMWTKIHEMQEDERNK